MAGKENIRTCLFCGCGGWAAFLYDRTPSGNRGCVSGFSRSPPGSLAIFPSWGPYIIRQQIQPLKGQVRIFSYFLTFESYRKVAWRAREDGWPCEALRCSTAPAVCCGTGECTGRSILLPGVNTSLNFRRSGEHSFGFRSMSEHRQVRVYGESR